MAVFFIFFCSNFMFYDMRIQFNYHTHTKNLFKEEKQISKKDLNRNLRKFSINLYKTFKIYIHRKIKCGLTHFSKWSPGANKYDFVKKNNFQNYLFNKNQKIYNK